MNIFGTFDPYHKNIDKNTTLGIAMANYSFIRGLIKYGSFDEYHFFIENENAEKEFYEFRDRLSLPESALKKLRFHHYDDIPDTLKNNDFKVFHNWDPMISGICYVRENFASKKTFPVISFVHAIAPPRNYEIFIKSLLSGTKSYDAFICPSNALKVCMQKYLKEISLFFKDKFKADIRYNGRFEVIPLGIDTERFKPRKKREVRKHLGLPENKIIVSCITRLSPVNKMDLFPLVNSFKKVISKAVSKNAILLIVGKEQCAGYAGLLKELAAAIGISGHVIVKTDFRNEDVPLYYSASDVFVSVSDNLQETFGLTPIEAMLSGIPPVISDWNGYKELVDEGKTGFKVPTVWADCNGDIESFAPIKGLTYTLLPLSQSTSLDSEALTRILVRLIDNPALRDRIGENARISALKTFSWEKIIPRIEKLSSDLHKESQKDTRPARRGRSFLKIPYFELFSHYPTFLLNKKTKIKRTPTGDRQMREGNAFISYELINNFNNPVMCKEILERTKNWIEVSDILKSLPKIKQEEILYQIMHMLKHDLLACRVK